MGADFSESSMAIRFRIADTARGNMESLRYRTRRRAIILMVVILSVLLGGLAVTKILIASPPSPEFIVYQGESQEDVVKEVPKVRDISGGKPPTAPPVAIIASNTPIAQPTFTVDVPMDDTPTMSNTGFGDVGGGLGDGLGEGSGRGGMGGKKMDSAFSGYFWDLKRSVDGKASAFASEISNEQVLEFESNFYNKNWDPGMLVMYMRSKMQLYSTCFFMPNCKDQEAVHAYDPTGKQGLKKSRWLVLYRAKVKAPASGTFRFVGAADTVMAVRFNGRNVLACGLHNLRNAKWHEWLDYPDEKKKRTLVEYQGTEIWNQGMGGFEVGDPVTVEKGEWYEMQVMISEIGGGEFGFCLLIDEDGGEKKTTKDGKPLFQLFRTAFSSPTVESAYEAIPAENKSSDGAGEVTLLRDIPYDPDSRVWEAKAVDISVKMK